MSWYDLRCMGRAGIGKSGYYYDIMTLSKMFQYTMIAIIAIIYFYANPLPKVVKRSRIPGLTGGNHSYIQEAAIAVKIS